jgi:hypothetical protein
MPQIVTVRHPIHPIVKINHPIVAAGHPIVAMCHPAVTFRHSIEYPSP